MENIKDIDKIIHELLLFRRSRIDETVRFNELEHNRDLCPMVQDKVEAIVEAFKKYKNITYDIQGIKDRGTDVLFRETFEDKISYICFQIKAQVDLDAEDYLSKLKAQRFESSHHYKDAINYYILICCDIYDERETKGLDDKQKEVVTKLNANARKNKNKIRNIEADLSVDKNLTIIEPQYVKTFLDFPITQIDAITKAKFGETDIVLKTAYNLISALTPSEISLLCYFIIETMFNNNPYLLVEDICQSASLSTIYAGIPDYNRDALFNNDKLDEIRDYNYQELKDEFVKLGLIRKGLTKKEMLDFLTTNYLDLYFDLGRDFPDRVREDLEYLLDNFIQNNEDKYSINLHDVAPLSVCLLDASIRYGYQNLELLKYIVNLFNINNMVFTF